MKTNLSAIALGLVLAYTAAPVMAQTATINQSSSATTENAFIEQSGSVGGSFATINQSGSGNHAGTLSEYSVGHNTGEVTQAEGGVFQYNTTGSTATVNQSGTNEIALVYQHGGLPLSLNQIVNNAVATITQSGTGNEGEIYQHDGASNLKAVITQTGKYNKSGTGNQYAAHPTDPNYQFGAYIEQNGASSHDNEANILQSGGSSEVKGNTATIKQTGSFYKAEIVQTGDSAKATIEQSGAGTSSTVNDTAWVHQAAANTSNSYVAYVYQSATGGDNHAGIYQH